MALLILLATPFVLRSTPTDILPEIRIPVVSIVWSYSGFPPKEMRERIVSPFEKALTTTVNDIEHIEAQSMSSVGVVKVFFIRTLISRRPSRRSPRSASLYSGPCRRAQLRR